MDDEGVDHDDYGAMSGRQGNEAAGGRILKRPKKHVVSSTKMYSAKDFKIHTAIYICE
jgi:hypothetical protein